MFCPLALFSTTTGDAWLLDPEDRLALCLARGGDRQSFEINDTATNFAIGWSEKYHIDGDAFIVKDQSGQIRTILGYPAQEIVRATSGLL